MARTIYYNNSVEITARTLDKYETSIEANGENLIVISNETEEDFKRELSDVLSRYSI